MKTNILFLDVNGTILDDWEPAYEATIAILEHYGAPKPTLETFIREVGLDGDYRGFYQRRGIHETRERLYELWLPAYHAHAQEVILMPGVHDALSVIKSVDIEIHILTAARKTFIEPILVNAGIHELCDSWHYHVHNKADQVHAVIAGTDIDKRSCVLVGDLPSDIRHAKLAGIRGVGFKNQHVPTDAFEDLTNMDFYAYSFEGLTQYLTTP